MAPAKTPSISSDRKKMKAGSVVIREGYRLCRTTSMIAVKGIADIKWPHLSGRIYEYLTQTQYGSLTKMNVVPVTIGALAPTNEILAPSTWRGPARPDARRAPSVMCPRPRMG